MDERILITIFILLFNNIFTNDKLQGVYYIISLKNKNRLINTYSKVYFRSLNMFIGLSNYYMKIKPVNTDLYNIESLNSGKLLIMDNFNNLKFININDNEYIENIYWKIIKIKDNEYLIQNNKTKKFFDIDNHYFKSSEEISDAIDNKNFKNISVNYKFKLFKLFEEPEIKDEYMKYIDEEPVDVVIKYIDLSDKTLNREGIHQILKDEDHEELRYSVRSVFENIPWFRKIFIVMPNEKVKYFKPIEEIKDRIVYIKDKDVIGFDTASNRAFLFRLWNLLKFNVSENIILMDDDYFMGKPIKKSDFFYYDEEKKKVLPNIVSDQFKELNKEYIYKEYNKLFSAKDKIEPNEKSGSYLHMCAGFKLLLENYPEPLVDAGYTHNALSLNIHYAKEIYDLVKEKYQYANNFLYSKERTVYDIQFQTLYNTYVLNIKKGKVHTIPRKFFDLSQLRKGIDLDIELFVINTSGENKYTNIDFQNLKNVLENKFSKPILYEIVEGQFSENRIINTTINFFNASNIILDRNIFNAKNIINKDLVNKINISNYNNNSNIYNIILKKKKKRKNDKYIIENGKMTNWIFMLSLLFFVFIILLFIKLYKHFYNKGSNYKSINGKEKEKVPELDEKYSFNNN